MYKTKYCLGLLTAMGLALGAGCTRSESAPALPAAKPAAADAAVTVARLHWLGKQRLAAESNATNFMTLWNLPESAKLETQTLAKLATLPWQLFATGTTPAELPAVRMRPLLDDVVQKESYLEVQAVTNQPVAFGFAIRLDAARAALWRTNLPVILASLYPAAPAATSALAPADFSFQTSAFSLRFSRVGDWTLLAVSRGSAFNPPPRSASLLADFAARIQRDHAPFAAPATNYWLDAEVDLHAFADWNPFAAAMNAAAATGRNLPRVNVNLIGDGPNVRTRGTLLFPQPLALQLEPWNIPTNLVHDPLIGFMAMRGIRPVLTGWKAWAQHQMGVPPNQAFFWAQDGTAPLHFFAAPSASASNQLHHLSEFLLNEVNPLFAYNMPVNGVRLGAFEATPGSQRLHWRGVPLLSPNVDLADAGGNPFITGGLFRNLFTNRPPPAELLSQFQSDPKLLLYDWELTQPCAYRLIQVSQLGRFVFGRPRLSMTNNAALPWMVAISPKLGNAVSSVHLAEPNRITFARSSALGLTGLEIHLLADWLESPTFPKGFFTLETKPAPLTPGK